MTTSEVALVFWFESFLATIKVIVTISIHKAEDLRTDVCWGAPRKPQLSDLRRDAKGTEQEDNFVIEMAKPIYIYNPFVSLVLDLEDRGCVPNGPEDDAYPPGQLLRKMWRY
ncbi:uncharacterized protein LY79DRAFT_582699 [Colletotrichum navitas]|uniref:Uncharacterized protein n=1 Tax=Colletotrichum navitas TaxID=681940 RepID=A0AAD8V210_9PEZI|nr:uncharacterized protein LY79DRAFT_582699 [Colletotrichum navitas]KAK1579263.1 hypothetical protein LY79DRAFT_582699 [Colletotrichum navitas]